MFSSDIAHISEYVSWTSFEAVGITKHTRQIHRRWLQIHRFIVKVKRLARNQKALLSLHLTLTSVTSGSNYRVEMTDHMDNLERECIRHHHSACLCAPAVLCVLTYRVDSMYRKVAKNRFSCIPIVVDSAAAKNSFSPGIDSNKTILKRIWPKEELQLTGKVLDVRLYIGRLNKSLKSVHKLLICQIRSKYWRHYLH